MDEASNQSVVMLFPGALGDLLLALPALRALRRRHAGAHTTLAVGGWLRELAVHTEVADVYASLDDADTAGLFGGTRVPRWFGCRPAVYGWLGRDDPAVRARLGELAAAVQLFAVERGEGTTHAATAYARQIGLEGTPDGLAAAGRLRAPRSRRAAELVTGLRRPVLVVHSGAGSEAKRWAPTGFAAVADAWRRAGGEVVHVTGPADSALPRFGGAVPVVEWALPDVAALLASADAYVGNDSGISHLAAAVGTRGVVVFGPTAARRWKPMGDAVVAVEGACRTAEGISLEAVSVATVVDAMRCTVRLPAGDERP
ncbi:MAG: glycosyltransferase family 9 protein [Candidatus Binatia bacterium]